MMKWFRFYWHFPLVIGALLPELAVAQDAHMAYQSMTIRASDLINKCRQEVFYTYADRWDEESAKRHYAVMLQAHAIATTTRSLAALAVSLNFSLEEFKNLSKKLLEKDCAKSAMFEYLEDAQNNLLAQFEEFSADKDLLEKALTQLKSSNEYTLEIKSLFSSGSAPLSLREDELNFAIHNYRALCAWDNDIQHTNLLADFLNNPYVAIDFLDSVERKKVSWISCVDRSCRKVGLEEFQRRLPRMLGSESIAKDFETLYCDHFRNRHFSLEKVSPAYRDQIRAWTQEVPINQMTKSVMSYISQRTKHAELSSLNGGGDMQDLLEAHVELEWETRFQDRLNLALVDFSYEEPLVIEAFSDDNFRQFMRSFFSNAPAQLKLKLSVGEMDKSLTYEQRIKTAFHFDMDMSFFYWLHESYRLGLENAQEDSLSQLRDRLTHIFKLQLRAKKELLSVDIWADELAAYLAREVLKRLSASEVIKKAQFDQGSRPIRIELAFAPYALKYLSDKRKVQDQLESLTFEQ